MTSSKRDILANITLVYCLVARAEAFVSTDRIRRQRPIVAPAKFPLFTTAFTSDDDDDTPPQQRWLDKGLLLSSFTDGLETNPDAQDWLCDALIENLWKERQQSMEISLSKSNEFSPCNGPDIALFEKLEDIDKKVKELYPNDDEETSTAVKCTSSWRQSLKWLVQPREKDDPLELRLVYVPTALYALRRDSNNTPGKQRQRARADGKKRRDAVVRMLADRLLGRDGDVTIASVTLDLDDGSIKQPESTGDDGVDFPRSGKEAIQDWKPHLIYVQGGNTFWLHHCMEKGDWGDALIESCCTNESDEHQSKAVYIGVSAGAILIGNSMQTACWKGWDDPSVVPGKETYDDWNDVKGLALAGSASFFPHMEDQWQDMVDDRIQGLPQADELPILCCLRDDEVCFVDGRKKSLHSTGALRSKVQVPAL